MKYKIEFGFGVGEDRDGNVISIERHESALGAIRREAATLFGGYTLTRTEGGWRNPQGRLVEEPGYTLSVLTDYPGDFPQWPMIDMAGHIKRELSQEAVYVVVHQCSWEML